MRKKWRMMVAVLSAFTLCGCGVTDDQPEAQSRKEEREQLVIWSYYETQAQRSGLDKLIQDFNQSQNRYTLSWEYVPMTGFAKGLSSAYTENKLPDMVILDNPDTPSMIQLGMFEDITEAVSDWKLEEEYYSSILETVCYEEHYYGIPFNCNNTALIYNKKMLKEAGVLFPSDWETLEKTVAALTTKEHRGFLMCGMEGEQGAFQILSWILAAGGTMETAEGEALSETIQFFGRLLEDGSMSGNCINLTQTDVAREFVNEKAAVIQNGPWVLPMLDDAQMDYGIAPIPGKVEGAAVVGGENIAVVKGKNTSGSLAFLNFCMNGDEILEFCQSGSVLPAKISAAEEMAKQDERMAVFVRQMEHAVTRTSIPQWENVAKNLTDEMYQLVKKQ